MSSTVIAAVGAIITATITAVFTYLGARRSAKAQLQQAAAERELGLIDRWEKVADDAETRADRLEERVNSQLAEQAQAIRDLKSRVSLLEKRERVLIDYAASLRTHINQHLGPPAPPWPDSIH